MPESRDTIKSRMLRTVANTWDYPGVENEAAFDPLVALLINACAAELAKINREKKLSQSRLTEEITRLLIPDAKTRATPAHAIASASPSDIIGSVDKKEEFLFTEHQSGSEEQETYFTPTARFPLVDGKIKFQASNNNISQIIDHKYKNILGYTERNHSLPASTLYLGIELNNEIRSVDEISFFFNLLNAERKDFFFRHLKNTIWSLDSREIQKTTGYPSTTKNNKPLKEVLENRYRTNDMVCREINKFYERQFITLQNIQGLENTTPTVPNEIKKAFDTDVLDQIDENLVWIEVQFPNVVSPGLLDDIFCFTNCFPVLNRQTHDLMFRLQDNLNIIPLKSSDFFFDVKHIVDSQNEPYHVYDINDKTSTEENSVLLRTSGVGRFGAFEAKEELQYLLETLKDETASYAAIGTETIENIVSEINVLMGDLEEKIRGMSVDKAVSYLVMRNLEESESLFVEYWTTRGSKANNIEAGNTLETLGRSSIEPKNTVFITPTVGGKDRLSDEEKINSFKRTLLANNRLVTNKDIKVFCKEQLGSRIEDVAIKKGLAKGINEKEGLVQTINIVLTPNERVTTSSKEWDFLLEDLLTKIRSQVTQSFPYQVVLDTEDNPKVVGLTYHEAS